MTTLTQEQKDSIEAMIKEVVRAEIEVFQSELAEMLNSWAERLETELNSYGDEMEP